MKSFISAVTVTGLAMSALVLTIGPAHAADPPACKVASGQNCVRVEIVKANTKVRSLRVAGGRCLVLNNLKKGDLNHFPNVGVTSNMSVQPEVSTYSGNGCQSNTGFLDPDLTHWSRWTDGNNYRMVGV